MSHFSIIRPIESQPATVFSPAISFLRNTLKLPIRRIADALQISETNVGTILSRGAPTIGDPGIDWLLNPDAAISSMGFCSIYGIRPRASRRALPEETPNLDELEVESNLCLSHHRRAYDFIGGAAALLRIRERIGHPRHPRFILLLARIHAMRCWLLGHVGFGVSALREASLAIPLLRYLHRETGDAGLLREMCDCYIAAANASMLRRRPLTARLLLERARQACVSMGAPIPWKWFQLQATSFFVNNEIEQSRQLYLKTLELVEHEDDKTSAHPSQRHLAFIERADWERQSDTLREIGQSMGKASREFSMQLHWTVAAGQVAEDAETNQRSAILLDESPTAIFGSFGQQATINHLLRLTERLNLPPRERQWWVRFLMYENAYCNS